MSVHRTIQTYGPLPQCHLGAEEPVLCRRLRLRQKRQANRRLLMAGRGRPTDTASASGVRDPAEGSSRGLHRLGGVRTQSEATRHQQLWPRWEVRSPDAAGAPCSAGCWLAAGAAAARWSSTSGRPRQPVYRCDRGNLMLGVPRCMMFGGLRVDAAVAQELIRAVEPMAIEAAVKAERRNMEAPGRTTPHPRA